MSGQGWKICIYNEFTEDSDIVDPGTTLWESLHYLQMLWLQLAKEKIDNVGRLKSAAVGVFTSYKFEKDSNQNFPLSVELVVKHLLECHRV